MRITSPRPLKVVGAWTEALSRMHEGTQQGQQESEKLMTQATVSAREPGLDSLLSASVVRPDAVARARRLLESPSWCRAEEVAERLVECYVGHQLP